MYVAVTQATQVGLEKLLHLFFFKKSELSRAFSATQRDGLLRVTLKKDASKILSKTISKLPMSMYVMG